VAAAPLTRQQRRKERRDLLERGRKALERGLPRPVRNEDALGIVLALIEGLEDEQVAERASRLADQAETLLDRTMARELKGLAYACRKGCGWCCWQRVTCTAPEVFRVAQWMRANAGRPGVPTLETIARAEATEAAGSPVMLPDAAGVGAERRPCALLLDDSCSIHPGRPIPCRAVLSMSAEACRKAMVDPATADPVPLVVGALDTAEVVRTLMLAAVSAKGLGDAGYDLPKALLLVLPDPTAEARWLAGEDVLAGVRAAPRPPEAQTAQRQLAEMLRPLLDPS
jgi:hypothetical protein